jgi:molecular chaperone HscB
MNYFDFYNIPVSFKVDAARLKQTFFANSKKYHPDFHTMASAEKQAEILELSTLNTQAYKILSNFDARMKYILDIKGILADEGKNTIPQDFLMDMMDINEALMELEFDFDPEAHKKLLKDVQDIENQLLTEVQPLIENDEITEGGRGELELIKNFYLKKRYLLRIRENLSKFAPL